MKILSILNGQTKQEVLQIENPLNGFLVYTSGDTLTSTLTKIEVVHVTRDGAKTIIPKMSILQASSMGVLDGYEQTKPDPTANDYYVFVPITAGPALNLDGGYITLRIESPLTAVGSVYAVENVGRTNETYKYEIVHLNAGVPKALTVAEATAIIIPVTEMPLSTMEITYANGERVSFDSAEIEYLSTALPEKYSIQFDGLGAGKYFAFSIEGAVEAKLTSNSANNVVLVK